MAIGQGRGWEEDALARSWFGKLPHQGRFVELVSKKPQGIARTRDEGERILAALPADALLIATHGPGGPRYGFRRPCRDDPQPA